MNNKLTIEQRKKLEELKYDGLADYFSMLNIAIDYHFITKGAGNLTQGTWEYLRNVEISKLLQQKYVGMDDYNTPEAFREWLQGELAGSSQSGANALSRVQGDMGEVEFLRSMQGRLHSLIYDIRFPVDETSRIISNFKGIDLVEINRFTGNQVCRYQVKTVRNSDSIKSIIHRLKNNPHFTDTDVLVGPKELLDEAKREGLTNKMIEMGSVGDTAEEIEALKQKILEGKMPTEYTLKDISLKIAGGMVIGGVVSAGISSLRNYLDYKNGKIIIEQAFTNIGEDAVKGAISGGALSGLSIILPCGVLGWAGGFAVGIYLHSTLTNVLDEVFGKGLYLQVLTSRGWIIQDFDNLKKAVVRISANEGRMSEYISNVEKKEEDTGRNLNDTDKILEGE